MALSVMLRNAAKLNAIGLAKTTAHLSLPIKTLTTKSAFSAGSLKTLTFFKNAQTLQRSFSLSAAKMAAAKGNHTPLWTAERLISLALLGVVPGAFIYPSQTLDALLAISVVLHSHWGVEAIITDYARPQVVGPLLPKVAHGALIVLSIATLGGLFYIIQNDVGIANSVKQLWKIRGAGSEPIAKEDVEDSCTDE
ncbi:PREDICTED: succinate dehydrogenase [ubiquinone] cytochrome b small subunit, mitochondrial [Rhagoletis zephyria]|uniref:succinate dehydrogenase [ubiquinone] cytochrome b small subunit, mitochondrial n=1 Tax=Rhagoletis zephyria TaxID=28612 RepID=UPI0008116B06|nr:PREDICTED: succinate dehydrogenase [ubiquinone] cytochrome b small subunit, mitochondrial [Rhagoletis zephyria]